MKYFLVLDSNIWVSERLLYTPLASAALYSVAQSGAMIGLPEIVEMEVSRVMLERSDAEIAAIQKALSLLRQISRQPMQLIAPTRDALRAGIAARWKELEGSLRRIPFTLDHARAGVERVIAKSPPSGPNNEQFRDCCIWQAAIELAAECPVHLVTNDHAFYEGGNRQGTLAASLRSETRERRLDVHLHSSLAAFLASIEGAVTRVDEKTIGSAIVSAIMDRAIEIATRKGSETEVGACTDVKITGYSTPKASAVAVSFSVQFDTHRVEIRDGQEKRLDGELITVGSCSFNPGSGEVTDVAISEWTLAVKGGGSTGYMNPDILSQRYGRGNIQVL